MNNSEVLEKLRAYLKCQDNKVKGINAMCNHNMCDDCDLCYMQGTTGEHIEAIEVAIQALEKLKDNEPCCRCDSITANINKAKVNSLEIITRMLDDKPYYELKYRQVGKKDYSIGYSSYDLKTVLSDINTYFEIVENNDKHTNADRIRNMSDEELAEFNLCPHMVNWKKGNYDTCVHPNDKDACKKCMLEWLQSEAE
jgi:hypothetical protein